MKLSKFLLVVVMFAICVFAIDLLRDSYFLAGKACFAWNASKTFRGTVSFLPTGLATAINQSYWLGPFIRIDAPPGGMPDANLGWVILGGFAFILVWSGTFIVRQIFSLLRSERSFPPVPVPSPPAQQVRDIQRKFSTEFLVVVVLVLALFWCGLMYMKVATLRNDQRQAVPAALATPDSPGDRHVAIALTTSVRNHELTPENLRRQVAEATANGKLNPTMTARIYGNALAACQLDYLNVLEKFPMKPSPSEYDRNYMSSLSVNVSSPECDKYYQKMGWTQGCEVPDVENRCQDFKLKWAEYQKSFLEAQKNPSAPFCVKQEDCFLSEPGVCGERLIGSRLDLKAGLQAKLDSDRCPLQKRRNLCIHENPTVFAECVRKEDQVAVCQNAVCTSIPLSAKLNPPESSSQSLLPEQTGDVPTNATVIAKGGTICGSEQSYYVENKKYDQIQIKSLKWILDYILTEPAVGDDNFAEDTGTYIKPEDVDSFLKEKTIIRSKDLDQNLLKMTSIKKELNDLRKKTIPDAHLNKTVTAVVDKHTETLNKILKILENDFQVKSADTGDNCD